MFLTRLLIKEHPIRSDHNNYKPRIQITKSSKLMFWQLKKNQKKKNRKGIPRRLLMKQVRPLTTKTPQISQKRAERVSNWAMQADLLLAGWTRRRGGEAVAIGEHVL